MTRTAAREPAPNSHGRRRIRSRVRDVYAGHMLMAAAGLNEAIGETEIRASDNALDVRASFTEGDIERVIGLVGMMRQLGR